MCQAHLSLTFNQGQGCALAQMLYSSILCPTSNLSKPWRYFKLLCTCSPYRGDEQSTCTSHWPWRKVKITPLAQTSHSLFCIPIYWERHMSWIRNKTKTQNTVRLVNIFYFVFVSSASLISLPQKFSLTVHYHCIGRRTGSLTKLPASSVGGGSCYYNREPACG